MKSVKCLFRVRVNKIESTRDLDGNLGKRIELLEEREVNPYIVRPQSDEAKDGTGHHASASNTNALSATTHSDGNTENNSVPN